MDSMRITIEPASVDRPVLDHLSELGMLETACVLGTGANGEAAWGRIPVDAFLLGVNGAVEIPLPWPLQLQARMVFDTSTPRLPWYEQYTKEASALTIMGYNLPCDVADYRFVADINGAMGEYLPENLVGDCTVGGAALDLLRHCRAELGIPHTVYLCGLDFGGGYYFKRDENGMRYKCVTPGVWGQLDRMNALIRDCVNRGMRILTLSETELKVDYAD